MMELLDPLPRGVRTLTNEEGDRLKAVNANVPSSPDHCVTCKGIGSFVWWDRTFENVVEWKCDCVAQWVLHRYLLHCGIGLLYQRLCWNDAAYVEKDAYHKVAEYLASADRYVDAGFGLILYGGTGTGKTLLSTLMLKGLVGNGFDAYFTTFSSMLETFRSSYRDRDEKTWFYRRIKNAQVLVLDDVGKEVHQRHFLTKEEREQRGLTHGVLRDTTESAGATFDEVLRHRVANSMPTIITTNLDLTALHQDYGGSILSLLRERSSTYRFTSEDFRDNARNRTDDEIKQGLTRPVVLG